MSSPRAKYRRLALGDGSGKARLLLRQLAEEAERGITPAVRSTGSRVMGLSERLLRTSDQLEL